MARKTKTFTLEGRKKSVEVYELTFNEIKTLLETEGLEDNGFEALFSHFGGKLVPLLTNLTSEDLVDFTPSEAHQIWCAVKEVNAVFFDIVSAAGVDGFLQQFKDAILTDCSTYVASLLSGAITKHSTTDTPT